MTNSFLTQVAAQAGEIRAGARARLQQPLDECEEFSAASAALQQAEINELRRVILGLVQGMETKSEDQLYLFMADIELEIQDAREALAKAGLL